MKHNYISFLLCVALLLMYVVAVGQTKEISGEVIAADDNSPMVGVNVIIPGVTQGTITDVEGQFVLEMPQDVNELVFSFVGYRTDTVALNGRTQLSVVLEPDIAQLEDVVVVGYGIQRRSDVTGSIAQVEGEDLARQQVQTPTEAVQGRMAGVQVISSGAPNTQPQIRVRGTGSMLAGVEPLYVVDGVLTDDIRNINTSDITSMEVLKDASAAIYGVRAANGVIIITTRQGEAGPPQLRYDGNAGFRQPANLVDMANRQQYVDYLSIAAPGKVASDDHPPLTHPGSTDWYDAVLRNAFHMNHNVSISGGSDNHRYYFSSGYLVNDGVITTNNFDRFTLRANNDINLSEKFTVGAQLNFSRSAERDVELGNVYRNIYRAAPVIPVKEGDRYGNTSAWGNVGNPLLGLEARNARNIRERLMGTLSLDYDPFPWLTFHTAFNTDIRFPNSRTYFYQYENDTNTFLAAGGTQRRENSQLTVRDEQSVNWVWDNTLTFDQLFGDHALTVMAGAVTEEFYSEFLQGSRIDVPEDQDLWYLNLGNPDVQSLNESGGDRFTRQSFLGRINYRYAGKYLLTASFRADGSSKFSERWGYFPTVGLGWVLSEESFLQQQSLFNRLKLRGSWGILGNDNIPTNSYITTANINIPYFFNNNITLGSAIQDIKDAGLQWERTIQYDVGLEFEMLNSRLLGEIDYYNKETEDALIIVNIPAILGDPDNAYITNAASYRNRGWEFSLTWRGQPTDDFSYSLSGNLTFNNNEITGLSGGQALLGGPVGQQSFVTRSDNGVPIGSFYVRNVIGIFQSPDEVSGYTNDSGEPYQPTAQPGDFKYEDIDNDGDVDNDDKYYAGSYQPKYYYGFNFELTYGNFDLSANLVGNGGNKIYNGKRAFRFENTDNIEADYAKERWTQENPSNEHPRIIQANTPASDYFVEPGDFLRLNNVTLGYTIPVTAIGLTSLRLYVSSQNVYTLTGYSGFTPELPGGTVGSQGGTDGAVLDAGIELNAYPTTRTFAFGVNATF